MATKTTLPKLSKEEPVKDEISVKEPDFEEGLLPRYVPKFRRKYPVKDVSCTDKDRAAALGMGSENDQDTKEVKKKKDSNEEYIKRKEFIIHTALIEKNLRENKPLLALYSANRALDLSNRDKKTLIARAKCYLYLGQNDKALDDIETALHATDNDTELIYMKAQTLYMMGNFEFAAVYFQRGMQMRPQLKKFSVGLQKAQYAIQNALGGNTRIKLTNYQVERLREKHQQAVRIKKFKDMAAGGRIKKAVTPGPGISVSPTPSMIRNVRDKHKKKEENTLLGLVAKEKVFCRDLIQNPNLYQVENMQGRKMAEVADDVVNFLKVRQEFWRQQKPVNMTRTQKEIVRQVHLKLRRTGGIVGNLPAILKRVEATMEELVRAEKKKDWHQVVTTCQILQGILLPVSYALWPPKAELFCAILSSMGKACQKLGFYERELNCHQESLRLAKSRNLETAKEIALENLANSYSSLGMYEKSVTIWREWYQKQTDPAMRARLLHEIGRCYLQLSEPREARKCGRQAIAIARGANNDGWLLTNMVLVAECEVELGHFQKAVEFMAQTVKLASKMRLGNTVDALERVRSKVDKLVREANLTIDDVEMTLFVIAEEEKEGLFPKELVEQLKNLKDAKSQSSAITHRTTTPSLSKTAQSNATSSSFPDSRTTTTASDSETDDYSIEKTSLATEN